MARPNGQQANWSVNRPTLLTNRRTTNKVASEVANESVTAPLNIADEVADAIDDETGEVCGESNDCFGRPLGSEGRSSRVCQNILRPCCLTNWPVDPSYSHHLRYLRSEIDVMFTS
jgi:hypothetical protein